MRILAFTVGCMQPLLVRAGKTTGAAVGLFRGLFTQAGTAYLLHLQW